MKAIILLTSIGFCLIGLGLWAYDSGNKFRASQSSMAVMPSLSLVLMDSVQEIDPKETAADSPIVFFYFSPDCEHCQALTRELIDHINLLLKVRILMFSPLPLQAIKAFNDSFRVSSYKNITLAYDQDYSFYKYFKAEAFPCLAIFDKNRRLVKLYRRQISIDHIINAIKYN